MIEFLTVSSVNADNRKRDVFPGSRGQCVRGAQAHGPWGHYFYSNTSVSDIQYTIQNRTYTDPEPIFDFEVKLLLVKFTR